MAITSDKSAIVRYQKPYFFPNNLNVPTWTRPSDWLSIPSISTGEQVVYALMAVYNDDSNYAAVSCLGNYTVDWGDGSQPQNYSSNTKAQYKFTYSSLPSNTITSEGYRQALVKITPQAGANLTAVNFNQRHSDLPYVS